MPFGNGRTTSSTYTAPSFLAHYHKRSNVETTFHMVKAKFGPSVRSKSPTAQVNEVLLKLLCHNVCVLIQVAYDLGVEPLALEAPKTFEPTQVVDSKSRGRIGFLSQGPLDSVVGRGVQGLGAGRAGFPWVLPPRTFWPRRLWLKENAGETFRGQSPARARLTIETDVRVLSMGGWRGGGSYCLIARRRSRVARTRNRVSMRGFPSLDRVL